MMLLSTGTLQILSRVGVRNIANVQILSRVGVRNIANVKILPRVGVRNIANVKYFNNFKTTYKHLHNNMNQDCLYRKANNAQRHDAEQIIKEYGSKLQWRSDGCDALVDVGSGPGDVLMDFIYTIMPAKFEKLVGTDISPKMVNSAKNYYSNQKNCDFRVLDIATEKGVPNDMKEQFDHVTSFYCLHWIQNQRQAMQNIYNLLRREGGDCLLVFLATNRIYDVYKIMSKSSKWSSYLTDVDQFISPFHFSSDPKLKFHSILKDVGFSDIQVDLKQKVYVYEGEQIVRDNIKAICPFLERIPLSLHDNFMDDIINTVTSLKLRQSHHSNKSDSNFNSPYKLIVAYAKKPPTNSTM